MFDDLKKNIEQEKKIVADMRSIQISLQNDSSNQDFYLSSLRALAEQLVLLNRAVPDLLKEWSPIKNLVEEDVDPSKVIKKKVKMPEKKDTVKMSYISPATKEKRYITINKADKKEFLKKLKLSEGALVGIKKMKEKDSGNMVKKPSAYEFKSVSKVSAIGMLILGAGGFLISNIIKFAARSFG